MKPKILLVGAGGHCRSCIEVIESRDEYRILGVVGLPTEVGSRTLDYKIIAADDELPDLAECCPFAFVTVGQIKSAEHRISLYTKLKSIGFRVPSIVASSAIVSSHSVLGEGTVVMHGAVVNAGVRVGVNTIINTRALIEHDTRVGDHCHVSTGAIINGGVTVGDRSFVGSGAVVREGISLGVESLIGARTFVVRHQPDHTKMREEA